MMACGPRKSASAAVKPLLKHTLEQIENETEAKVVPFPHPSHDAGTSFACDPRL